MNKIKQRLDKSESIENIIKQAREIEKIQKYIHISLANPEESMYTLTCCGMIAMKREVAAQQMMQVVPWSECHVRKLTTSHCTGN